MTLRIGLENNRDKARPGTGCDLQKPRRLFVGQLASQDYVEHGEGTFYAFSAETVALQPLPRLSPCNRELPADLTADRVALRPSATSDSELPWTCRAERTPSARKFGFHLQPETPFLKGMLARLRTLPRSSRGELTLAVAVAVACNLQGVAMVLSLDDDVAAVLAVFCEMAGAWSTTCASKSCSVRKS
jgi:hypothetical protein